MSFRSACRQLDIVRQIEKPTSIVDTVFLQNSMTPVGCATTDLDFAGRQGFLQGWMIVGLRSPAVASVETLTKMAALGLPLCKIRMTWAVMSDGERQWVGGDLRATGSLGAASMS